MQAHKRWHYMRDGNPSRFVRWFIRFRFEPIPATIQNVFIRALYSIACLEMPWEAEAREEEEEEAEHLLKHPQHRLLELTSPHSAGAGAVDSEPSSPISVHVPPGREDSMMHDPVDSVGGTPFTHDVLEKEDGSRGGSETESDEREREEEEAEEAEDIRFKRGITAVGFVAVYVSWVRYRFSSFAL